VTRLTHLHFRLIPISIYLVCHRSFTTPQNHDNHQRTQKVTSCTPYSERRRRQGTRVGQLHKHNEQRIFSQRDSELHHLRRNVGQRIQSMKIGADRLQHQAKQGGIATLASSCRIEEQDLSVHVKRVCHPALRLSPQTPKANGNHLL
jgi:hypothetical protein